MVISCSSTRSAKSTKGNAPHFEASVPSPTDDGLSFETAIVITEKTEKKGIAEEYKWLQEQYTAYVIKARLFKPITKNLTTLLP